MNLKFNRRKSIILTLVLGFLLVLSPFLYSLAENTEELNEQVGDKKQEIENLDDKIRTLEEEIEKKKSEKIDLSNQLELIDSEITKTETEIEQTRKKIEKVNLEIANIENQIEEKELEITRQKEILSGIIREIYQYDRANIFEIIFAYKSLSDYVDQTQHLETVEKEGKQVLDNIKQIKKELEWQEQVLRNRKETLGGLKTKLDKEKIALDDEKNGKEKLLIETEEQEEKYQELLEKARAEQQAANAEIVRLQREIERKIRESKDSASGDDWESLGGAGDLDWPIYPTRGISAYFMDPTYYDAFGINHYAIDIPASQGSSIHAPADGYLVRYRDAGLGYSYIVLYHGEGMTTVYGHVTSCFLSEGQHVNRGDVIGLSGGAPGTRGAGWLTTGPHLHFEVRTDGNPVDPLSYLVSI